MIRSQFGNKLKVEIWGGSHEPEIGVIVAGLPQGVEIDLSLLGSYIVRRATGISTITSSRRERDIPVFKSGLSMGMTDGSPLEIVFKNEDVNGSDYEIFKRVPRPGHADMTAAVKYKDAVSMDGGGPFSGRMTLPLTAAGAIAVQILRERGIRIGAHLLCVGGVWEDCFDFAKPQLREFLPGEFPALTKAQAMRHAVKAALDDGDSVGGVIETAAVGVPAGLGAAMYDGAESLLAPIFFGIPAVKGLEFGMGFGSALLRGSENNDPFKLENGRVITKTNNAGGILGGITTGMPVIVRAAFKPAPSISKPQSTLDLASGENTILRIAGRHDPCPAIRAVPVCEAALALGILDLLLLGI